MKSQVLGCKQSGELAAWRPPPPSPYQRLSTNPMRNIYRSIEHPAFNLESSCSHLVHDKLKNLLSAERLYAKLQQLIADAYSSCSLLGVTLLVLSMSTPFFSSSRAIHNLHSLH